MPNPLEKSNETDGDASLSVFSLKPNITTDDTIEEKILSDL